MPGFQNGIKTSMNNDLANLSFYILLIEKELFLVFFLVAVRPYINKIIKLISILI